MTHNRRPVARGYRKVPKGTRRSTGFRILVTFDEDTFEEIRARAIKKGSSFAEEVRLLVQWGLDSEAKS